MAHLSRRTDCSCSAAQFDTLAQSMITAAVTEEFANMNFHFSSRALKLDPSSSRSRSLSTLGPHHIEEYGRKPVPGENGLEESTRADICWRIMGGHCVERQQSTCNRSTSDELAEHHGNSPRAAFISRSLNSRRLVSTALKVAGQGANSCL